MPPTLNNRTVRRGIFSKLQGHRYIEARIQRGGIKPAPRKASRKFLRCLTYTAMTEKPRNTILFAVMYYLSEHVLKHDTVAVQ